jgi:hypothetical protein
MPTLSTYSFERAGLELGGPFIENHIDLSPDRFAINSIETGNTNRGATLALTRPDDEDVVDLALMYNTFPVSLPNQQQAITLKDLVLNFLARSPYGGTLRDPKPLRSAPLNRAAVPSYLSLPPNAPNQVLAELHIDFHLNTPAGCYTHEGTITFYIQFLVSPTGIVTATPLAEWYTPDTNPDVCAGTVTTT